MRDPDRFRTLLIALGALCLQGCSWITPGKEDLLYRGSSSSGPITVLQLEDEIRDLADRFAMGVAEAVQRLVQEVPDADRRGLLQFRLKNATSAYDAVTSEDALEGMLDLLTLVELQNLAWLDERRIERYSGHRSADFLAATLDRSRKEAWALAERALTRPEEAPAIRVADLPEVRQVVRDASSLTRSVADWPSVGRSLILIACGGLASVVALAFLFRELSRRRARPAEVRPQVSPTERPPTRVRSSN